MDEPVEYRVGIDAGGTFTDLVALADDGTILVHKLPSDRNAPDKALIEGLVGLAARAEIALPEFLASCSVIVHGSTVALNTLIQRNGAKTAMLVTEGHEDSIEIRLGHKEDGHRWDFRYPAAKPLVPAERRLGVRERVLADGRVYLPLDEQQLTQQIERLAAADVQAVAVSCLWSFLHPQHEQRIEELLRARLPDCFVSTSLRILPRVGEYTRTSTTVANTYVGPAMRSYLEKIEQALIERGFKGDFYGMQSNGGVATPAVLGERPVAALNSGPAGGPVAAAWYGRQIGQKNVISVDMGGTSFDICLVKDGLPDIVTNADVARVRIGLPMVNVTSIGAGGGSIARIDERGLLQVGPESAEADPGPACYGRGGTQATVTDALVVAGYLPDTGLLGGAMAIDPTRANEVVQKDIAAAAGIDVIAAARGIIEVTVGNMVEGIRSASIERGHDPRDYVLVVGGGAGPAFAGLLARELGITQVLIPNIAGALCALGEATADLRYDSVRACPVRLSAVKTDRINQLFTEMEAEGGSALGTGNGNHQQLRTERSAEMKYIDQIHYCDVRVPDGTIDETKIDVLRERFHHRHRELYTYCETDNEPEIASLRVSTIMERTSPPDRPDATPGSEKTTTPIGTRRVALLSLTEPEEVPVYRGQNTPWGAVIPGPAIVEEETATIVVEANDALEFHGGRFYTLTLRTVD